MKKCLLLFLTAMFATGLLTAQEWRWAHTYGGMMSNDGFDRNRMQRIALDSAGNMYFMGMFGSMSNMDGSSEPLPHPAISGSDGVATVVAKFDPSGNLVWDRQFKSRDITAMPWWMELKGNRLYIMANTGLVNLTNGPYIYYWDSLVYRNTVAHIPDSERTLPFNFGSWTAIVEADLDGNIINNHFVSIRGGIRQELCDRTDCGNALLHRDKAGNTFTFATKYYTDTIERSVLVDNDWAHLCRFHKSSNAFNVQIVKFSPLFQPLWTKWVIDHIEGAYANEWGALESIHLTGMSYDEDDNMYVTGYLTMLSHWGMNEGFNDYPCYIYLDSTEQHYIRVDNDDDAQTKSFIIKYDTDGNVLWVNQPYSQRFDHNMSFAWCYFFGNQVADSSVYVLASTTSNKDGFVYFNDDTNTALPTTQSIYAFQNACFVRFDQHTGQYLNHGGDTSDSRLCNMIAFDNSSLAVTNNQVVYLCGDDDFVHLMRFSPTGTLLSKTPICDRLSSTTPLVGAALGYVATDEQGHLALSMHWNDAPDFNLDTVAVHGTQGHSNVIFAMAYDENLTIPYEPPLYTVTTRSSNSGYGHVIGDGTYPENTIVTLNAIADHNWTHFVRWQDGDTNNPRTFRLTQDTLFTAFFETNDTIGIPSVTANALFTLTPNPAHDYVALDLKDGASAPKQCTLIVSDASGREVLSLNIAAPHTRINTRPLPKGMYFVTLTTPQGSNTQKLVVE